MLLNTNFEIPKGEKINSDLPIDEIAENHIRGNLINGIPKELIHISKERKPLAYYHRGYQDDTASTYVYRGSILIFNPEITKDIRGHFEHISFIAKGLVNPDYRDQILQRVNQIKLILNG